MKISYSQWRQALRKNSRDREKRRSPGRDDRQGSRGQGRGHSRGDTRSGPGNRCGPEEPSPLQDAAGREVRRYRNERGDPGEGIRKGGSTTRELPGAGRLPLLFSRLLNESAGEMEGGAIVLHVDPRDEALCREVLAQSGREFQVVPDITTWGGVIVSSPDEQVRIHNTLESRLERAKNLYKKEVCRILFGE